MSQLKVKHNDEWVDVTAEPDLYSAINIHGPINFKNGGTAESPVTSSINEETSGNISVTGNVTISGSSIVNEGLTVNNESTFEGSVDFQSKITANGAANFVGGTTFSGGTTFNGGVQFNNTVTGLKILDHIPESSELVEGEIVFFYLQTN